MAERPAVRSPCVGVFTGDALFVGDVGRTDFGFEDVDVILGSISAWKRASTRDSGED